MKILKTKAKNLFKNEKEVSKGITLIALVITIIVLLILAGVSIATLTGDNGLLNKAGETKNEQVNSTVKELISLAWNEYQMELKLLMGNKVNTDIKVASTQIARIQVEQQNSLISANMTFLDYLREVKKVIDESGVIDVKALAGQQFHRGNGTDGLTDVYKIEMDEENKEYTLKYYGEASVEAELLLKIEDENMPEKIEIVEPEKKEDWEYTVTDGVATLTKYLGDDEILIVPNYINGIPVKQVGDGTNHIWDENNTDCIEFRQIGTAVSDTFQTKITEIKIFNGVEKIGDNCFYNIDNLKNVEIPSSINSIESCAFRFEGIGKTREMTLKIPKTVINVGRYIVGADDTIEVEFKNEEEVPDTWEEEWNKYPLYGTEVAVIWAQ